ncbi:MULTISPECIES: Uma2 family endonuclease [Methylobacterium]|uniref:Uma2 family endonuclease n=1 Tax=Methylobacterium TaxID=407 RepID=UPI001053ABFD|nr:MULTISPECIES: Uma2 family endonuclease [Methylobacterium]MDR7037826.1 Uma2 family endonuclease [Methylobacterium sp. BE186]
MSAQPQAIMTVEEFLSWAEGRPGRYELIDGLVVAMSPQRVRHAETKLAIHDALRAGLQAAELPCRLLPDGMTVRIDRVTAFEPDALIYCGERLDGDAVEVRDPIVVVEVLSPGTRNTDTVRKLEGYFQVASILHYLIVHPQRRVVIHHRRGAAGLIETRIVSDGALDLSPPGLSLRVDDLFPAS